MFKNTILLFALTFSFVTPKAQVVYQQTFSGLSMQSYTAANGTGSYALFQAPYQTINDSRQNRVGTSLNPNTPFNAPALKSAGWVISANGPDTFAVSTSWLDTAANSVSRWFITPTISVPPTGNVIFKWKARSPYQEARDGYELYVKATTNSSLTPQDFVPGDRLFIKPDNNTPGGGENSNWTNRSVQLLPQLMGQTVRIAFRNNSKDRFQLWIDDLIMETVPFLRDVEMAEAETGRYIKAGSPDSVRFTFKSKGAATIYSIQCGFQFHNSSPAYFSYTNSSGWSYDELVRLTIPVTYSLGSSGRYKVRVWVNSLNGLSDQNTLNDTATAFVCVQTTDVPKGVLLEQVLSANSGQSPDGMQKTLALQSNSVIIVNIHQNDSLVIPSFTGHISANNLSVCTAMANRRFFNDINGTSFGRLHYAPKTASELSATAPVSISIVSKSFNTTTRELLFNVKVDVFTELAGNYSLIAYLVENQVYGPVSDTTVNGYNQLNDFYSVPWSFYYQKGYFSPALGTHVLNAWEYKHQNVLLHALDGPYGDNSVIPSGGGTLFNDYSKTYLYTLPQTPAGIHKWIPENIYLVVFVAENGGDIKNKRVLNVIREKMISGTEVVALPNRQQNNNSFLIYPNPSAGYFFISTGEHKKTDLFSYSVFDLNGRELLSGNFPGGREAVLSFPELNNGVYFIRIKESHNTFTQKIVITR